MSDDLARLGLQVDSTQAVKASGDLDKLTVSSGKAEKATDSLKFSSQEFAAALAANGNNIEKATASLARNVAATGAVIASQSAAAAQASAAAAATATMSKAQLASAAAQAEYAAATSALWKTTAQSIAESTGLISTGFRSAQLAALSFSQSATIVDEAAVAINGANLTMAESLGVLGSTSVQTARLVAESEAVQATAAVESAAVTVGAHGAVSGSSTAVRESLTLLREASVGNFTRMAGSASILLQALGLLNAILIPLGVAAALFGGAMALATNQINSGVGGTGDLTKGLGLTADQLDRVKDRYVSFMDTVKATGQVVWQGLVGPDFGAQVQGFWNGVAHAFSESMILTTGAVQGAVYDIVESWKAMPKALGGEGTTANIDFSKAFQRGMDETRAQFDKLYSDIAAKARKNAQDRIKEEAGKATGTGGDHQVDSAQKQLQAAQNQLQSQTALNAAVQEGSMSFAEMTKQEKLDGEMKQIVAQRDADLIKNTVKSRQEAEALTAIIAKLGPVYSALYDQQMQAKQIAANDNLSQQNLILEKQIELAGKAANQREFEIAQYREILKLKQEGIDPSSALGQASLSTVGDNSRRSQAASRSLLSNGVVDSGTSLGTSAAKATLASDPDAYITRQKSAYDEIDKLRQQDVLSETQAVQAKARVDAEIQASRLSAASDFFGNLASLSTSSSRTLQGIGKAAAMTQAGIDGVLAVQKALAAYPPPINFIMAAGVGVAAAANVAKIAGFEQGGVNIQRVGGGPSDTLLTLTAPGESIINRQATAKNPNTLAAMNAGASFDGAAGGKGMQIQVIHDGSTGIQVQQMSEGKVRIIARQVVAEAAPDIAGSAVKEAKRQSPNWVADANKNPRRRASIG